VTPQYRFWVEDYKANIQFDCPPITAGQTACITVTYTGNNTTKLRPFERYNRRIYWRSKFSYTVCSY
jgi:hypothetical protein